MKKYTGITLVALLLLFLATGIVVYGQQAQPATPVQQTATHVDTCTPINGTAASGSQATLTIPAPPSSQFIYISEIDIEMVNAAAVTTGQIDVITSTNLNPVNIQWLMPTTTTIGTGSSLVMNYAPGALKATAPATKVTIVGPAGVAGLQQNVNACYYYGF
jgi:hypothetical protein